MPISNGSAALFMRINSIIFPDKENYKKHSNWAFVQIITNCVSASKKELVLIFPFNKIKEKNKNKNEKK